VRAGLFDMFKESPEEKVGKLEHGVGLPANVNSAAIRMTERKQ
jgi:hypothetical protein